MNLQFMIPSFNPSLSSSRKQKYNSYDLNQRSNPLSQNLNNSNQFDFSKKLFQFDATLPMNSYQMNQQTIANPSDEFWQSIYEQQANLYNNLMKKQSMLQQSVNLHRQALSLRNQQSMDCSQRTSNITQRIKNLSKKSQGMDMKIKLISTKCHQKKSQIENVRSKVHKQQAFIIQQQKHIAQIEQKKKRLSQQNKKAENQLNQIIEKSKEYEMQVQQHSKLIEERNKMKNQATFAKLKIHQDLQEQQGIFKKMKELKKIIKIRQKNNRELGKKLFEIKRTNPYYLQMTNQKNKPNQKLQSKLAEITKNIKDMQNQYGYLQQQLFGISQKIQVTKQKMQQKLRSLEVLKLRHEQQVKRQEKQSSQMKRTSPLNNTHSNNEYQLKNNQNTGKSPYQVTNFQSGNHTNGKKKPIIVIESQQNELFSYPKSRQKDYTNQNYNDQQAENYNYNQMGESSRKRDKLRQGEYNESQMKSYPIKISYSQRQNLSDKNTSNKNNSNSSDINNKSNSNNDRRIHSHSHHIHIQDQDYVQNQEYGPDSENQQLKYTQSFKNLLDRYRKIISNTHFKH